MKTARNKTCSISTTYNWTAVSQGESNRYAISKQFFWILFSFRFWKTPTCNLQKWLILRNFQQVKFLDKIPSWHPNARNDTKTHPGCHAFAMRSKGVGERCGKQRKPSRDGNTLVFDGFKRVCRSHLADIWLILTTTPHIC